MQAVYAPVPSRWCPKCIPTAPPPASSFLVRSFPATPPARSVALRDFGRALCWCLFHRLPSSSPKITNEHISFNWKPKHHLTCVYRLHTTHPFLHPTGIMAPPKPTVKDAGPESGDSQHAEGSGAEPRSDNSESTPRQNLVPVFPYLTEARLEQRMSPNYTIPDEPTMHMKSTLWHYKYMHWLGEVSSQAGWIPDNATWKCPLYALKSACVVTITRIP